MCVILVLICLVIGLDAGAHLQQLTTRGKSHQKRSNPLMPSSSNLRGRGMGCITGHLCIELCQLKKESAWSDWDVRTLETGSLHLGSWAFWSLKQKNELSDPRMHPLLLIQCHGWDRDREPANLEPPINLSPCWMRLENWERAHPDMRRTLKIHIQMPPGWIQPWDLWAARWQC